jgi:hypothetical protein
MKKVLLKDIVIPAGTVFDDTPRKREYGEGCYVEAVIGLTKDTAGHITYETSDDLKEWFAELRA